MMYLMSTSETQSHGIKLTRFLEKEWDARYTNRGAWCREVGLADSTVLRWSQGTDPDLNNLMLVADGLNRPLIEILYHAGYIPKRQIELTTVRPAAARVSVVDAIRTDEELSKAERDALLAVHAAFQSQDGASNGRRRSVRVSTRS